MSIFSSQQNPVNGPTPIPTAAQPPSRRSRERESALSVLAPDLTITGDLDAQGAVRIEGRIVGSVRASVQVIVSEGAVIEGDVNTKEAVIGGTVKGKVNGSDRVEIQVSGIAHGDITTPRLQIHEGGRVNGAIHMEQPGATKSAGLSGAGAGKP